MIGSVLAAFINVLRALGRLCGYELVVTLTEHEIQLSLVDPDDLTRRAWDPSHFTSGNLFLEGWANPIKPSPGDDGHEELIVSERYEQYMANDLVGDILQADASDLTLKAAVGILAAVQCLVGLGIWYTVAA